MTDSRKISETSSNDYIDKFNGTWTTSGNQRLLVFNDQSYTPSQVNHSDSSYSRNLKENPTREIKTRYGLNFSDIAFPFIQSDQRMQPHVDERLTSVNPMSFVTYTGYTDFQEVGIHNSDLCTHSIVPYFSYSPNEPTSVGVDLLNGVNSDSSCIQSMQTLQNVTSIDNYGSTEQNNDTTQIFTMKYLSELIDNLQIHTGLYGYSNTVARLVRRERMYGKTRKHSRRIRRQLIRHKAKYTALKKSKKKRKHVLISEVNNNNTKFRHKCTNKLTVKEKSIERARLSRRQPFMLY